MRYFFHVQDGTRRIVDLEGGDFETFQAARSEAAQSGRDILADWLRDGQTISQDFRIEIADEDGGIVEKLSRSALTFGEAIEDRYRQLYESIHHPYVLIAPDLIILEANPAFLNTTQTELSSISRRRVFDVFPDNPGNPDADGVRTVSSLLTSVVRDKQTNMMPEQRYDLRRRDGSWERRCWTGAFVPALDVNGEVEFIIAHIDEVTDD